MPSFVVLFSTSLLIYVMEGSSFRSEAALLASSSIEYCERDGNADLLPCETKVVVTLAVDNDQEAGVEEVVFVRDAKTSMGGKEGHVEFEPIRLTIKKSRVQYRYPVFYERNFNAKPYEYQIMRDFFQGCNDKLSVSATCGLVLDGNDQPIPYSQGFCCSCGPCQLAGICPPDSRSVQTCSVFGSAGMASCLRFDEMWYSGYNIGAGSMWYNVEVTLSVERKNATDSNQATLLLGPDMLVDSSPNFGAWARLVGDFASPEMPLDLTGKMLFVPSSPRTSKRVKAGPKEWMLLDKHLVTLNGRECNKVGVSYEAFAGQGDRCRLQRGACLADQLEDYRDQDLVEESKGGKGKYMVRFFGEFDFTPSQTTSSPYITYLMRGSLSTVVVVTISADNLRYMLSVSPGVIVSVSISRMVGVSTRGGVLTVTVRNTGGLNSQYALSVGGCTADVLPMAAQPVSLTPREEAACQFDLLVQDTATNGTIECNIQLRNARGETVDTAVAAFEVSSVEWTNGTQGSNKPNGGGNSVLGESREACGGCAWYNLPCFLKMGCWWQSLMYFLLFVLLLLAVYVTLKSFFSRRVKRTMCVERDEPVFVQQFALPNSATEPFSSDPNTK